ncbi:hypothetical protein [Listeria booriae]|uniref:hypothetical protein n=1 Tax=Listeria booriae TaxID=1552123 RepID=UPI00162652C6|nr:hypothetical protein [Listeria booriae]MBC1983157.1 hypothetical protein [Listeria booriae]
METVVMRLFGKCGKIFSEEKERMYAIDFETDSHAQINFYTEDNQVTFEKKVRIADGLKEKLVSIQEEWENLESEEDYPEFAESFWSNLGEDEEKSLKDAQRIVVEYYNKHTDKLQFILNHSEKMFDMTAFEVVFDYQGSVVKCTIPECFSDPTGIIESYIAICSENKNHINKVMNEDWQPLKAFKFLRLAKNNTDLESKYLLLSTAAELGVKEFFITKKPMLRALFYEISSPPLHKLYGKLMNEYFEIEVPNKKIIQELSEIRNEIVHKVEVEKKISFHDCNEKIKEVQRILVFLQRNLIEDNVFLDNLSCFGTVKRKSAVEINMDYGPIGNDELVRGAYHKIKVRYFD